MNENEIKTKAIAYNNKIKIVTSILWIIILVFIIIGLIFVKNTLVFCLCLVSAAFVFLLLRFVIVPRMYNKIYGIISCALHSCDTQLYHDLNNKLKKNTYVSILLYEDAVGRYSTVEEIIQKGLNEKKIKNNIFFRWFSWAQLCNVYIKTDQLDKLESLVFEMKVDIQNKSVSKYLNSKKNSALSVVMWDFICEYCKGNYSNCLDLIDNKYILAKSSHRTIYAKFIHSLLCYKMGETDVAKQGFEEIAKLELTVDLVDLSKRYIEAINENKEFIYEDNTSPDEKLIRRLFPSDEVRREQREAIIFFIIVLLIISIGFAIFIFLERIY